MKKLSFSLAGKSQSKKPSAAATTSDAAKAFESTTTTKSTTTSTPQYVTQFDPSEPPPQTLIIPPKPNEYHPTKKMKNLELPLTEISGADSHALQFEVESESNVEQAPDSMSYGLNVRVSNGNGNGSSGSGGLRADPMLVKYKEDMGQLTDVVGFEEFEEMPVEAFGAALLAGYGWKEGMGVGKHAKEDVKIVEFKKWSGKEGLGFDKEAPESVVSGKRDGKKGSRGGDEVNGRREEKGRVDAGKEARVDGRDGSSSRERRGETREHISSSRRSDRDSGDEELKDRRKERKHRGSEDVVEEMAVVGRDSSSNSRERRDKTRESNSSSRRSDRDGRDEVEARGVDDRDGNSSRARRDKMRENISSSRKSDRNRRDEDFKDSRKKEKKHIGRDYLEMQSEDVRERGSQQPRKSEKVIWLFNHIRVRVVSKAVKGGQLYLKKGEVVDVVGPSCDILMDESRELIQGVSQEYLETALPKRGGPVLVLHGKHKGAYGSLMEKDIDKETGVVRDADNHEMLNVRLEQIAEFIGDPSYIGY